MKFHINDYPEIREKVEAMSITDLIRWVICPNIYIGNTPPLNTNAVFIHKATIEQGQQITAQINSGREIPALIAADMESGAGSVIEGSVRFQPMRALKEAGNPQYAYEMGVIAAKDAVRAGYHWTFAPCVDILGNPMNPITSLRTAGGDPQDVIDYCGSYMRGLQDTGLIATLKHFPGDGYSMDDQHVTVTENPLSKQEWDETFGKVYRTLIDQGAMAIMPGHISLPAYDEADKNGIYPPATVSKNLLTGLLREQLGFDGIIVSDAVEMGGFCGYMNYYHACAAFLEAGGDCLLFVHESDELIREMKKCIGEGRLSLQTLQNRAYRMACFAKQYSETRVTPEDLTYDRDAAEALSETITRSAVKVIRDRNGILPFDFKGKRIAHVVLHNSWVRNFSQVEGLTAELAQIAEKVEEFRDPGPRKLEDLAKSREWDLIICSVHEGPEWAVNTAKLCGGAARNMMRGWMRFDTPVAFVVWHSICFEKTYFAVADTVINTYGATKYTPKAVADLLQGKLKK